MNTVVVGNQDGRCTIDVQDGGVVTNVIVEMSAAPMSVEINADYIGSGAVIPTPASNGLVLTCSTTRVFSWIAQYTHPALAAFNVTVGAGEIISNVTSNGNGHITNIAKRSLTAADIPTLAHTKISDWNEAVEDRMAAVLVDGSGIIITHTDGSDEIEVSLDSSYLEAWLDANINAGAGIIVTDFGSTGGITVSIDESYLQSWLDSAINAGYGIIVTDFDSTGGVTVSLDTSVLSDITTDYLFASYHNDTPTVITFSNTYSHLTSGGGLMTENISNGITFSADKATISKNGVYEITVGVWINVASDCSTYQLRIYNETTATAIKIYGTGANVRTPISFTAIVDLSANDVIRVDYINGNNTDLYDYFITIKKISA